MIEQFQQAVEEVKRSFKTTIANVENESQLNELKNKFTNKKKGKLQELFLKLKQIPNEKKPFAGQEINKLKVFIEDSIRETLISKVKRKENNIDEIDFTLPCLAPKVGHKHLLTIVRGEIENIFERMGYDIVTGPEIEEKYFNFDALNMPKFHPARDEQDTFYIKGHSEKLLRTQTSPMQIRFMQENNPPFKIISPGKVCRKDEPDATHTPLFHQVEGLLVDENIKFSHLKGTLEFFIKTFFGENIKTRFRPSYFPFTEPSAEVDMSCFLCESKEIQCPVCKGSGWIEILGSGMVHPQVLLNCNIDIEKYSGFAFGMGIERIAMLKYGVNDLRYFYENDLRFNSQFY